MGDVGREKIEKKNWLFVGEWKCRFTVWKELEREESEDVFPYAVVG